MDKTTTALYNNQKRTIYGIAVINNSGNGGILTIYLINGLPCKLRDIFLQLELGLIFKFFTIFQQLHTRSHM